MAREVERVSRADERALRACLEEAPARPLVIEGGARGWPAFARWTPDYLSQKLGSVEIRFKRSSSNAHPDFRADGIDRWFARGQSTFAEFLRSISAGEPAERARSLFTGDEEFLLRRRDGHTQINPVLAPLLDDVPAPTLFDAERLYTVWAWFSGPGVRTWLHYDNNGCHNLNAQLAGEKQCRLYAPEELPRLHPFVLGGDNPAHNCSAIDVERPEPEFATDLAAAEPHDATLSAGDLLFIPAFWFHTFRHTGSFNANVNHWWRPSLPAWNPVAARQALLDAAARAGLGRDEETRAVLRALDRAMLNRASM